MGEGDIELLEQAARLKCWVFGSLTWWAQEILDQHQTDNPSQHCP